MHFLLTLRVRCRLTSNFNRGKISNTEGPKKETKETTKTKAHKHTTNLINQAIITYYCYSHHNMHAHLSTQITRKLQFMVQYVVVVCTKIISMCGRCWRNRSYTKHWLNSAWIWMDTQVRTDLTIK